VAKRRILGYDGFMETNSARKPNNSVLRLIIERHSKLTGEDYSSRLETLDTMPSSYALKLSTQELDDFFGRQKDPDGFLYVMGQAHWHIEHETRFLWKPDFRDRYNAGLQNYDSGKIRNQFDAEDVKFFNDNISLYPYSNALAEMDKHADVLVAADSFGSLSEVNDLLYTLPTLPLSPKNLLYKLTSAEWFKYASYSRSMGNYKILAHGMNYIFSRAESVNQLDPDNALDSQVIRLWSDFFTTFVDLEHSIKEAEKQSSEMDPVLKLIASSPGITIALRKTLLAEYRQWVDSHIGVVTVLAAASDADIMPKVRESIMKGIKL
jgi:hypothetical protein